MNLGCLRQLLARNAAFLAGIGFHETAIHRQVVSLHQAHFDTLPHDLLKQLLKQLRLLEPSVSILREGGVVRDLLIEASPVNQRHARCMRSSSTNLRSLVMPYK